MPSIHGRRAGALDTNLPRPRPGATHRTTPGTGRLPLPGGLDLQPLPGAFAPDTELVARAAEDVKGLLAGQKPVGKAVEIEASEAPQGAFDLTVPYDEGLLAEVGMKPTELVVVAADGDGETLRELRPHVVDAQRRTLTVRVHGLSTFQPCTEGFTLLAPEVRSTATDEAVAYAGGPTVSVSGRVADEDAEVTLDGAAAGAGWSSRGWFTFEDVEVGVCDTRIVLRAERECEAPYLCELVVRRSAPRKRVARPPLYAAGDPAVSDDGCAYVATVLSLTDGTAPVELAGLKSILDQMVRPYPHLLHFDVDADQWRSVSLPPSRWIENEVARAAIGEIARVMQLDVPIDDTVAEPIRYLTALDGFFQTLQGNARLGAAVIVNLYVDLFGDRHLAASAVTPCVPLGGNKVGVAYVLADAEGLEAAQGNTVVTALERRHVPRKSDRRDPYGVTLSAGTLFFQEAEGIRSGHREIVAKGVLCSGLSAARDQETGEPMVLGLVLPTEGADASRRTALRLYRREAPNQWRAETVSDELAVLDADLAVAPDGTPWIVATVRTDPDDDLDGELVGFVPEAGGWKLEELRWRLDGGETERRGMWPRAVLDGEGRPVCAFARDLGDRVHHLVATPDGGGLWAAIQVVEATTTSLSGVPASVLANDFEDSVVGQSRAPYSHFCPAVARHPEGGVYWAAGDGVLRLAEVDPRRGVLEVSRADVDRTTGFAPRMATRSSGAPVLVFKDLWGYQTHVEQVWVPGAGGLQWLDPGQGHLVPHRPDVPGPVPGRWRTFLALTSFWSVTTVTCESLSALVLLMILRPVEAARALRRLQAGLFLGATIDIRADTITETVEITLRLNPPPATPGRTPITAITLRISGGRQSLFVSDASGNQDDGACGISQESWDALAGLFLNLSLDPTQLFPPNDDIEIERVEMRGLRITAGTEAGVGGQQGAMSFRLTVPEFRAEGQHKDTSVGFTAVAVEPSTYDFTVAPHLVDGRVHWFTRSVSGRYGKVDVDVETDFLTWIGALGALLTGSPFFMAVASVDPVLGTFFTDLANEELAERGGPPFGGFATLLAGLLAGHAQDRLDEDGIPAEGSEIEAIFLEGPWLHLFLRQRLPKETAPRSLPELFPPGPLHFGQVALGGGSARRNVLVLNNGALPVMLEGVRSTSPDFTVDVAPPVPMVVGTGGSARLELSFAPASGSPGPRSTRLEVTHNGGRALAMDLLGEALPAPWPRVRFQPSSLRFGVVPVGQERRLSLTLENDGGAPTSLVVQLQSDVASAGAFRVVGVNPQALGPGGSADVELAYRPNAPSANLHRANLRIDTEDPDLLRIDVPVSGQASSPELLVQPDVLAFGDSPLVDVLPPGLGTTRGFIVYNLGTDTLTLASSSFFVRQGPGGVPSPHYQLLAADGGPMPVADLDVVAGAFVALSVLFRPTAAGGHPAVVEVEAGTAGRVEVAISGRGIV